jgi:hypothetical protein
VDATTVAMCDLEDRIASDYETGFSEQALRQLMKEAFLLEMERKRQMGEAIALREGGAARHPPAGRSPEPRLLFT